jgi:hypothetical protein
VSTREADVDVATGSVHLQSPADGGAELSAARIARVGEITVRRLPAAAAAVGRAVVLIDHYGPVAVDGTAGMDVPPHPHIGPQTVTWLISGEVLHRDSLGSEQLIRPGQLNPMTAGRGSRTPSEALRGRDSAQPARAQLRTCTACSCDGVADASLRGGPGLRAPRRAAGVRVRRAAVTVFSARGPVRLATTVFWPAWAGRSRPGRGG